MTETRVSYQERAPYQEYMSPTETAIENGIDIYVGHICRLSDIAVDPAIPRVITNFLSDGRVTTYRLIGTEDVYALNQLEHTPLELLEAVIGSIPSQKRIAAIVKGVLLEHPGSNSELVSEIEKLHTQRNGMSMRVWRSTEEHPV